jgi:hypothetical protein
MLAFLKQSRIDVLNLYGKGYEGYVVEISREHLSDKM